MQQPVVAVAAAAGFLSKALSLDPCRG